MKHKHFLNLGLLITLLAARLAAPPAPVAAQSTSICAIVTEIPRAECQALVALYNSTGGPHWYDSEGWLQTATPCSWSGVTCTNNHVTQLNFAGNNLQGPIPPEFGNLSALTQFEIVPTCRSWLGPWGSCDGWGSSNLTSLPPEFGNLSNLTTLRLVDCGLTTLPPEFGNFPVLADLELIGNGLTSLPPEFGNLVNLTTLTLSSSGLTTLPPEFGNLSNLTTLNLSDNYNLTSLPPEFSNLAKLTILELDGNGLTSLPPEFGNLTNLIQLSLNYNNNLTSLPPEFGNLSNLTTLTLNGNAFTALPPEFANLPKLATLSIASSVMPLPPEIYNLAKLTDLSLNLSSMTSLSSEFGSLTKLTKLSLSGSLRSLPPEFGNLSNLTQLTIFDTAIASLPPEFGNLSNLTELIISNSTPPIFHDHTTVLGSLPPEFGNLSNLVYLDLHWNNLPLLPPEFGNLTNLVYLDLEENPLLGEIPLFMSRLTSLGAFKFGNTKWCVPTAGPVAAWLNNIPYVAGNNRVCNGIFMSLSPAPELYAHMGASFTAKTTPYTSLPIAFTWNDGIHRSVRHLKDELLDTVWITWDTPGRHTLSVTVDNESGTATASQTVIVHPVSSTLVLPGAAARLTFTDTQDLPASLDLPAGSVTQTAATLLQYTPSTPTAAPPPGWFPANHRFTLGLYRDGRSLPPLAQPATLTLHYSEADIANVDRPADLQLMRWNAAAASWQPAACGPVSHDLEQRVLSLPICQLGDFALFGPATLTKAVTPTTPVKNGDILTYTLVFSDPEGSTLRLFDPISPALEWLGFVSPPPGSVTFTHATSGTLILPHGAISGALTLSPTLPLTLSFSVRAQLPGNRRATVSNTAFFCEAQHTGCTLRPSNTVVSTILFPSTVFLPLVMRSH